MKKLFKIIAIVLGILVALLVVATIALKIFFPAEKVKGILLKELSSRLHREVTMGDVSVGVLKGLQASDLKVSEAHTFAQGTFVSVDKLSIRVKLLPLLSKRIEVDSLVLTHPKIAVTRAADGKTFNFSDLIPPEETAVAFAAPAEACGGFVACAEAAPAQAASGSAIALQVSTLEIDNGEVHFLDRSPAKQSVDLDNFDLKVKNFSLTDWFTVNWRAKLRGMGLALVSQGGAKVNLETHALQLSNATVTVGESKLAASGRVADFASAAPQVDLTIAIDALTPASFGSLAGLPPALIWTGAATGHAKVNGTLQALNVDGDVNLDDVQLRYGTVFQKPTKTPLSSTFSMVVTKQNTADVKSFHVKLNTLTANGRARIDGLAQKVPTLSLHLATNAFSVPDLLKLLPGSLPPGITVKEPAQISADISGTPASLNINTLALTLGKLVATISGRYMTVGQDARLDLALKTNDFPLNEVAKMSSAAAGYQLTGPGHLDMKIGGLQSAPSVDGVMTVQNADIKGSDLQVQQLNTRIHFATPNALAPEAKLTLKTDGQLTTANVHQTYYDGKTIKLVWNLSGLTQDQSQMAGTAQFSQGAGSIRNAEQLVKQYKKTGIVLVPFEIIDKLQSSGLLKQGGVPALKGVPFDSLQGDYAFKPGTMEIHTFDLNGHDVSMHLAGSTGLVGNDPPLNLSNCQIILAQGLVGGTVGELFRDDQGRTVFKFSVTGTQAHPNVIPDLRDAGKKAIQKFGDQLFKGSKLGDSLKNILGR